MSEYRSKPNLAIPFKLAKKQNKKEKKQACLLVYSKTWNAKKCYSSFARYEHLIAKKVHFVIKWADILIQMFSEWKENNLGEFGKPS